MKWVWSFLISILVIVGTLSAAFVKADEVKTTPSTPAITPAQDNAKAQQEEQDEADRLKYQKLLTMKDQSGINYYEEHMSVGLMLGSSAVFANPNGAGLGVQQGAFLGGLDLMYKIHPQFGLGGFISFANYSDTFFDKSTMLIPLGVEGNFYPWSWFYLGLKTGFLVETLSGNPQVAWIFGPQVGVDFRVSELVSIGAEFGVPVSFGYSPGYALINILGQIRFWF